jgi:hypothetical protein
MNKSLLTKGTKLFALAAGVVLFTTASYAQDLYNGATGKINNEGTIRINDDSAIIDNDAPINLITNNGEIHIFGNGVDFTGTNALTSATTARIPGYVSYRSTTGGPQNIHEGYYDDLDVQAVTLKSFGSTDYFIGGDYTTAGGDRIYTGSTVTYDGGTATTGAATQIVAAENTGNGTGYNDLVFSENALKTLSSGLAYVGGTTDVLATSAGSGVSIDGATSALQAVGAFTQATGAGDYSLNNGGLTDLEGDGNIIDANLAVNNGTLTLGDGSNAYSTTINNAGSLNLANAATAVLNVDASATMNVNGGFTNLNLARDNQTFAGTSTVDYQDGASDVVTTAPTNPYGNFIISNTADISPKNNGGTEDDINVATSFEMSGGSDLVMIGATDGAVNFTNATSGNVTYAGQEEVIGRFRRTHAFADAGTYVFGNAGTSMNFATAPTTGTYFEVNMNKDGSTENYDNTRDVDRDVNLAYDNTGWTGTAQVGYTADDIPGTWIAGYTEDQIRYLEGNADPENERIATGNAYVRNTAGSGPNGFSTVALPGMTYAAADLDFDTDAGFFSSNELILRAGPGVVVSINPGRWSNPDTWDSGAEPLSFDSVVVRHNVWAGFVRDFDDYTEDEATPDDLAAAINILTPDVTYPTPTLMLGYSDDTMGSATTETWGTNLDPLTSSQGRFNVGDFSGVTEKLPTTGITEEVDFAEADVDFVGGLIVFGNGTPGQGAEMNVEGELINNGCINVGGVLSLGN